MQSVILIFVSFIKKCGIHDYITNSVFHAHKWNINMYIWWYSISFQPAVRILFPTCLGLNACPCDRVEVPVTILCLITMTSLWAQWRLKLPASWLFTQPFIQAQVKESIKAPRHWPWCLGNSPVTGEFPEHMASNAENVSFWSRPHIMVTIMDHWRLNLCPK